MNTASIKPGDIVLVNKKGRKFHAVVEAKNGRTLSVKPIDRRINYYTATSREVEMCWHKSRQKSRATTKAQEAGDGE